MIADWAELKHNDGKSLPFAADVPVTDPVNGAILYVLESPNVPSFTH